MELTEAMRSTGTCRYFSDEPVSDDVLYRAFDDARFGPQGGNRQPVRWIVVRDAARKQALAQLYLAPWKAYLNGITGGGVRVGVNDSQNEGALPPAVVSADYFAEHLAEVPALLILCAKLDGLHPTDNDLGRLSVVGGASIYPIMQNVCLSLRDQGVASAVTTLLCLSEPAVREMLQIPEGFITAAHIAVGRPAKGFPRKLTRDPVESFAFAETFGAPLFPARSAG